MPATLCRKFAARSYALYSKDCNGLNPKSIPARIANISKRQIKRLDRNAFLNTIGIYIASWGNIKNPVLPPGRKSGQDSFQVVSKPLLL
jgi:hypothetical protein